MADTQQAENALGRAGELLVRGVAGDDYLQTHGRLGRPLVILHPAGGMYSWFVPMTISRHLVGFMLLSPELEFLRFTVLQRRPGSLEGAPDAADWLAPERVLSAAARITRPDERLTDPVLTYDQVPDRLAWRVEARSPDGTTRRIMVAGGTAYEPKDLTDTIGGQETIG